MEEPSVLDYVKAKLAFWRHSSIDIPKPEQEPSPPLAAETQPGEALVAEQARPARPRVAAKAPALAIWLSLGALVIALIAQSFVEPPNRAATTAAILYGIAALMVGAAYLRGLVAPAAVPEDDTTPDSLRFHPEGLIVGLILMVLAFLTFAKGNQDVSTFNFINTSLWLLSIAYLVWTFYLPRGKGLGGLREKIRDFFAEPAWRIRLTGWSLLVLAVVGLVLFFRFYRLTSLPAEPVSDHAEKLLDVNDVLNGQLRVFFPRNTGREAFQFYWTALIIKLFNTGISFFSLKLGTVLIGLLTLFYMYRVGKEIGNRWVALLAVLFCGFSYWANIQSRIGLRFPLYPGFYAPVLFHTLRGLRTANRNDFIWAGLWMGIGLQGYTSFRIVPLVALVCFVIYWLHHRSFEMRRFTFIGLAILALVSLAVLMPLFRFTLDDPQMVASRSLTRISTEERPLPGPAGLIFASNTWNALTMFFWNNGDVWVHSIPNRPAMDVIGAALFFLGLVLVALRYIRKRTWMDLFMLLSIPLLLLPSILSLAFPNENPNLNRTAAAYVPAFLIAAVGLEGLLSGIRRGVSGRVGIGLAAVTGLILVIVSAYRNYDLVFNQYDLNMRLGGWNTSEMGAVVRDFDHSTGRNEDAWVVAYPYWVDTRLVGIASGYPTRDMAIDPANLGSTSGDPHAKLFLLNPQDNNGLASLSALYPDGRYWLYPAHTPGKDFIVFLVPPAQNLLPDETSGTQ